MPELPITPPSHSASGAKPSNRPAGLTTQESPLAGEETGSLFDLALQASMSVAQIGPVPGWPGTSLTPDAPLPAGSSGGNLPVLVDRHGKGLPPTALLTGQATDFADMELLNGTLKRAKVDGAGQGLLFRELQTSLLTTDSGIEAMGLTTEGGVGRSGGQFSLQSLQGVSAGLLPRSGVTVFPMEASVGQPGWDRELGERIHWMLGRNIQNAEVKLTPPHLGPLEIRVSVQNDQASVSFLAAQAPTREALEAAIPRLREMLGEANLSLANVNVGGGEGSAQWAREQADGQAGSPAHRDYGGGGEVSDPAEVSISHQTQGLVDHYV